MESPYLDLNTAKSLEKRPEPTPPMGFLNWSANDLFALQKQAELNTNLNMLKQGAMEQNFPKYDAATMLRVDPTGFNFHRSDINLPRDVVIMLAQ